MLTIETWKVVVACVAFFLAGGFVSLIVLAITGFHRYKQNDFGRDAVFAAKRVEGQTVISIRPGVADAIAKDVQNDLAAIFAREHVGVLLDKRTNPAQLMIPDPPRRRVPLLTAKQVARRMRMSKSYVYEHALDFPFTVRTGKHSLRFDSRLLEEFLAEKRAARDGAKASAQ